MTGPPPATAAVRVAVRRALEDLPDDQLVVAAVSGGADSLALAAGLAFERPAAGALLVDHRLQEGSDLVAARAAEQCRALGLAPVEVLTVAAPRHGEAAAREARYALLSSAADRLNALVLLGHTRDDQAETVLLGLTRGAGARALSGMAAQRDVFLRPLLDLPRAITLAACAQGGLEPWLDPHNEDPTYARVRVRRQVLPVLEDALGPGVAAALARTARQLREDADALDALTPDLPDEPSCAELAALPAALRSRALKRWAERGCGRSVTSAHVQSVRALVEQWAGQGPVALPGGSRARRTQGTLRVEPPLPFASPGDQGKDKVNGA